MFFSALFISMGKLISVEVFPLMYFILNVPSFHWQCHVNPGSWACLPLHRIQCYSPRATGQTDSCLERVSREFKQNLRWGPLGLSMAVNPHLVHEVHNIPTDNVPLPQTIPTITPMPSMGCYSKCYYKFDNISNYCRKSANTNSP